MKRFILASASPRRRELLDQMGAVFEIIPAEGEEHITKESPAEAVMELALQKAQEVAARVGDQADTAPAAGGAASQLLVLGADTVVVFDGKILGKPADERDAMRMLSMLNGSTHSVYTGVSVILVKNGVSKCHSFYEETRVTMHPMSREEIEAYVATGEPMDKAGAYGIQGKCAIYIAGIQGDYNNVVGLPIARIYQELKRLGISIPTDGWKP